MNILLYQMMSLVLAVVLLGVPVVIAVLIFRHLNRKDQLYEMESRLSERIRDLEERIERLEEG